MATFKKRYKWPLCDLPMSPWTWERSKVTITTQPTAVAAERATRRTTNKSKCKSQLSHNKLLSGLLFFNIFLTIIIINPTSVKAGQVSHSFASFNSPSLLPVASSYSSLTSSTFSIAASPPSSSSSNDHNPLLNSHHARDGKCNLLNKNFKQEEVNFFRQNVKKQLLLSVNSIYNHLTKDCKVFYRYSYSYSYSYSHSDVLLDVHLLTNYSYFFFYFNSPFYPNSSIPLPM